METTIVGQIFGGFLNSQVKCLKCNGISCKFEGFHEISLEIKDVRTLVKALQNYVTQETLSGDNSYMCAICNINVPALEGNTITKPPNILTVMFQRFDRFTSKKSSRCVQFQEDFAFNMRPYLSCTQEDRMPYRLYAVFVHFGASSNSGHYCAYVNSPFNQWHAVDDSKTEANKLKQKELELWKEVKNKEKTIREKDSGIKRLAAENRKQLQESEKTLKDLKEGVEEKEKINSELKQEMERLEAELKISEQAREREADEFTSRLNKEKVQREEKLNKRLKDLELEQLKKDQKAAETISKLQATILKLQEENKRIRDESNRKFKERVAKLEKENEEMKKQLKIAVEKQILAKKAASKSLKSAISKFFKKLTGRNSSSKEVSSQGQSEITKVCNRGCNI